MPLIVETPPNFSPERTYILSVILEEFLGLRWRHQVAQRKNIKIFLLGEEGELILPDTFFSVPESLWLTKSSLPSQPLRVWDYSPLLDPSCLIEENIPIIFGDTKTEFIQTKGRIQLPIDIFGSAFFTLTRYEEVVTPCCNEANPLCSDYGCFRMASSLAYQEKFLHRPIVDEYVEILWSAIKKLWNNLERKKRKFKQKVTCDVDCPFDFSIHSYPAIFRRTVGDLVKRKSISQALKSIYYGINFTKKGLSADPYWKFDWMMDVCEHAKTKCAFYFITDTSHLIDGIGYWGNPEIEKLLLRIYQRGHEIGLHTSYNTYNNLERIIKEFKLLQETCNRLKIKQSQWGGRQHYLRWKAPITWRNWDHAKLNYDTTLTFTESPGFRCGTCHPYRVFDVLHSNTLNLYEHPLIVMECSIFSEILQNLGYKKGEEVIKSYKETCRKMNGEFTLLWHNSYFSNKKYQEIYKNILFF